MPDKNGKDMTDHDMLQEIYHLIVGNGNLGLCKRVEILEKFRFWVVVVVAFMVGAGLLSFGSLELLKAVVK